MKNILTLLMTMTMTFLCIVNSFAVDKSRGLWAFKSGNNVFVSWRMRATDAPKTTTYKLYADGNLVSTLTDKTNVLLSSGYASSSFSLEVYDSSNNLIDSQSGVSCDDAYYRNIQVEHPGTYTLPTGTTVTYEPNDCSAYDMDGDGEQEIVMTWFAGIGATAAATAPPILDCIKLDGTRLWRINLGPNILGGCRFSFLCYDFDGDGYGEVITKTAPGSKDATGSYLSKGVAAGADHSASSINSAGVITDGGKEWITCYDGRTGKELATIDYWPYFNIQSDWDDRANNTDGSGYGHRGNWLKGCVATLPVNGKATPCAVTVRGIYTYSYAASYTWDGKTLSNVWKHTSDKSGQGIYGQGAHSLTCGDVDGDGYDEIIVGAACLDHDGTLKWRTGLGHGDATHLGEFDPSNDGLEYFMITEEETAAYDCAMIDAKTGKILMYKTQTGGDTGRGLALDCDDTYDGAECMEWSNANLFSCNGTEISAWHVGSTSSSSINGRIFWDGDLLEEYTDRGHVDKWDSQNKSWGRLHTYGYNIYVDGNKLRYGANTNNSTKYNPCLQADLIGDWREESVFWTTTNDKYFLTIYSTNVESPYKLPWLRDDHVYDMAVAWQHCGYNQTPHLGYSPVEYYKNLESAEIQPATLTKHGAGSSSQTVEQGTAIQNFYYTWANATSVMVTGLPEGVTYTIDASSKNVYFSGTPTDKVGSYVYTITTVGGDQNTTKSATIKVTSSQPATLTITDSETGQQTAYKDSAIAEISFFWTNAETVEVIGLPQGVTYDVDVYEQVVYISGCANDDAGLYEYTVTTVGGKTDVAYNGTIQIVEKEKESTDVSEMVSTQQLSVAPNPMCDYAVVAIPAMTGDDVTWSLSDMMGKVVLTGEEKSYGDRVEFLLHRTNLMPGVYLLRALSGAETHTAKIVVK